MRRAFRPALLNLEVRSLLSAAPLSTPTADYAGGQSPGTAGDPGSNPASGSGSTGGYGSGSGYDSTGGSGSGSAVGYSSGSGGGSYMPMPSGLGDDINLINSHASLVTRNLAWETLLNGSGGIAGNAPWGHPSDFTSRDPYRNTYTSSYGDLTFTTVVHTTYVASYSGSDGGSWVGSVVSHSDYTDTTTGTDDNGRSVNVVSTKTYDLNWQGSGDSSGTGMYKVKLDQTEGTTEDHSGGSGSPYQNHNGFSAETHMTAEGEEAPDGTISGQFTLNGSEEVAFSLTDGGGGASDPTGLGYNVSYSASSKLTLDESGPLLPDGSGQGSASIDSSETGDIVLKDADNGFLGFSRKDGDSVKSTFSGSPSPSTTTPTGGNVDPNGPKSPLVVPTGKHVVNVIDKGDRGWFSWPEAARASYAAAHGIDPNKTPDGNIANGDDFLAGIAPRGPFIYGYGAEQVAGDLRSQTQRFGLIDVLVIADHGGDGVQELGNDILTPDDASTPGTNEGAMLDMMVSFLKKPGGTLVVTGCSIFSGQPAIDAWQAYATANGITIMGSASPTGFGSGDVSGVWVTLVPGGTAPTLTSP